MERFVAIDVETTGLSPARGDRVIEVGAVALEAGEVVGEFVSLVAPGRPIPHHVSRIHGITDEMLRGQPRPEEIYPALREFIGGGTLVAHNARFDLVFLRHEFGRLGLGLDNSAVCTLMMARQRLSHLADHRLETVARHLLGGLQVGRLHRALDDARLTARVWEAMTGPRPLSTECISPSEH
ncbi:DNA polymerase III subunit epsilon [Geotalea uraniireducens]|uniref:DNA polymerase III subunit epsilon n=1 Tax=Geotalea uraniireducens TaxID=351604 RepID=A0ABM8EMH0_9BACT|nr:3'-5' exonuclease [Geotalea uraniireducens]BDV43652.1 DNA polymerase III subunit epsilon [Geotalea uraniireducens]